jgi:hypothetical protein
MQDSRRFRENADNGLLAARATCEPRFRSLNLLMAQVWLSLAKQDDAMDGLLAIWEAEDKRHTAQGKLAGRTGVRSRTKSYSRAAPVRVC